MLRKFSGHLFSQLLTYLLCQCLFLRLGRGYCGYSQWRYQGYTSQSDSEVTGCTCNYVEFHAD